MADFGISEGIALAAAASSLAASGMAAYGSMKTGQETAAANNYNADVSTIRGQEAQQSADAQAQVVDQQNREKYGQAAAAYGAAGVDMSGSPLEVMHSLALKGELNRRLTVYNGTVQNQTDTQQAALDKYQATSAVEAGATKAGSSLLTGVTNFAGNSAVQSALGIGAGSTGGGGRAGTPSPS
jgi:hypothetical protein